MRVGKAPPSNYHAGMPRLFGCGYTALFRADARGGIPDSFVKLLLVDRSEDHLQHLCLALGRVDDRTAGPGLAIQRRIANGDSQFDSVGASALPALLDMSVAAERRPPFIEPRPVIQAERLDHQRIAFPLTDRISIPV